LDGDCANNDEFEFNPPKIDDCCCCWIADGGRISNADELVGTMLTEKLQGASDGVYVLNDDF
jgi:hypothetical protein